MHDLVIRVPGGLSGIELFVLLNHLLQSLSGLNLPYEVFQAESGPRLHQELPIKHSISLMHTYITHNHVWVKGCVNDNPVQKNKIVKKKNDVKEEDEEEEDEDEDD